jgi:hypothetical protein
VKDSALEEKKNICVSISNRIYKMGLAGEWACFVQLFDLKSYASWSAGEARLECLGCVRCSKRVSWHDLGSWSISSHFCARLVVNCLTFPESDLYCTGFFRVDGVEKSGCFRFVYPAAGRLPRTCLDAPKIANVINRSTVAFFVCI